MEKPSQWEQLQNLKEIYEAGFITRDEYSFRKRQIIDELTGTTTTGSTDHYSLKSRSRKYSDAIAASLPTIVPHPPPDFSKIIPEKAIKYVFDLESAAWQTKEVTVKIDEAPFARGGLRLVFHLLDVEEKVPLVAKISVDPRDSENREIYLQDVLMQTFAKEYAAKFNSYNPPKHVDFVKAYLLELIERPGNPLCGVERYIEGSYRKHNNNYGYVSEEERNTPQAFSHFSYEASNHSLLICDIQGVGDMYTDPQIHTSDHRKTGKGDLGKRGIDKFLETHRCNAICRYLKLPSINADYKDLGTVPSTTVMSYTRVDVVDISVQPHLAGHIPLLAPRPTSRPSSLFTCCIIL